MSSQKKMLTKLRKSAQYSKLDKIRIPKDLEPIYQGFTYWIIKIIMSKVFGSKTHFIDKAMPEIIKN